MPEWGWGHHVTVGIASSGHAWLLVVDDINTMWPSACAMQCRTDSRFAPSQWETALLCNAVSHWLGASLESALTLYCGTQEAQVNRKPKPMVLHRVHLYLLKWSGAGRKFIILPWRHISNMSSQISTNSCLFNSLFRLKTKNISELCISGSLWKQTTDDWWISCIKGQ